MFYYKPLSLNVWAYIGVYCLSLFVVCMVCHGELAALAPPTHYLTTFYVLISLGGALGGVAVNLVAPSVFPDFWEFPLVLLGCWLRTGYPPSPQAHDWLAGRSHWLGYGHPGCLWTNG